MRLSNLDHDCWTPDDCGKVGAPLFPLITVVVVVLQVAFCNWWLKRFPFGPVERLWRSLTYGETVDARAHGRARRCHCGLSR
jgi:hypothetical protein